LLILKEGTLMSLYQVNKLLRDLNLNTELAQRCQAEPESVFPQYNLTVEEREAIKGWQVRKLYDMGANPFLLLVSSMATGRSMRAYVQAMNEKASE
jgi:aromatic-ring opening dioxygenase LigAB LigA subunit